MDITHRISDKLSSRSPRRLSLGNDAKAAVLLAIVDRSPGPSFFLTRRTETVGTHKGQISFPGGFREEADSDFQATALRETEEEVGISPGAVNVLGEFDDYIAITDLIVRPVVGVIDPDVNPVIDPVEVAYTMEVPFEFFEKTQPRIEHRTHRGVTHRVFHFDFDGEDIWGLTARIIVDFLELMK